MADAQPPRQPEPTDEQASLPPTSLPLTENVSQFAIATTPAEFLISLGHARLAMPQGGPVGNPHDTPEPLVEWMLTLSISPIAAVMLSEGLKAKIGAYEKKFGKIPVDPDFRVKARS
jgi:hypothetical protein